MNKELIIEKKPKRNSGIEKYNHWNKSLLGKLNIRFEFEEGNKSVILRLSQLKLSGLRNRKQNIEEKWAESQRSVRHHLAEQHIHSMSPKRKRRRKKKVESTTAKILWPYFTL
jgi:hypothetical protein